MAILDPKGGARVAPPDPWDPLVRITHWSVACAVVANGLIDKPGGTVHVWVGWAVMAVLLLRVVWGLLGPREARFASFLPDPKAALSHLGSLVSGRVREHPSHNPAGALMVWTLWGLLAVVGVTGLMMTDFKTPVTIAAEKSAVAAGDWSVLVTEDSGEVEGSDRPLKEVHEVAANMILILALVHVAGVAAESAALGRNLVRPMLWRSGGR